MNEFQNELILKIEDYQNGLFAEVPKYNKHGSAFILTGGIADDIEISRNTSTRQIRKGKYTKLVEISTASHVKEIRINSISKENAYSFEVYIKATIQVNDAIKFYENRNLDVDAYFENLFSMDVRKITRKYSILDYEGMDEELVQKLSSYNNVDEDTGFSYIISVVDAIPGEEAAVFVKKISDQQLNAKSIEKAKMLSSIYTDDFNNAVMTAVAEGKISEIEAIEKIEEHREKQTQKEMDRLVEAREKGIVTDKQLKDYMIQKLEEKTQNSRQNEQNIMKEFYEGEDEE